MHIHFNYLGYTYQTWDDVEEDNIKTFHECYQGTRRIKMPVDFYNHSPYSTMTYDEFVKHVQTLEVFVQG